MQRLRHLVPQQQLRPALRTIHELAERWIGKYERNRLSALAGLKKSLEARDE